VDIACIEWRSDRCLLLAGHRGLEMVIGLCEATSREFRQVWSSREITTSGYAKVAGLDGFGNCVLVGEGFTRAPEIAVIRRGEYATVRSFAPDALEYLQAIGSAQPVRWNAQDGIEIEGWLVQPHGPRPHPLVTIIHGGPVSHHRPIWMARASAIAAMLIKRGFALFYPNPRGSSGRGQAFAREVLGEMGGADALDCLSGIDHLIEQGIVDPQRLGITGGSYGGFMTSWLITQDSRFAAAVAVAPMTNHVSHHLVSNIPHFVRLFLADNYNNPTGKYFSRSPVMHAHKVKTPTLNICGALDRCTPAEEAAQFHNALLENGVESVLVTYPHEGHGVRTFPALIDYAARVVDWFERHLVRSPSDAKVETA
jgi:dipeptidyl aminopeptidase/acylaminoacyl peptidase